MIHAVNLSKCLAATFTKEKQITINTGIFFCLKTRESSAYRVMKCELSVSKHLKHTFNLKISKVRSCMCWVSVLHSCSSNELNYNNKYFCCKVDLLSVNSSGRSTREEERRDHEGRKRGSKEKHLQMLPEEESTCQSSRRPVQRPRNHSLRHISTIFSS